MTTCRNKSAELKRRTKKISPSNIKFCLYPLPPLLKLFWEIFLNHPHHRTSNNFHCYPSNLTITFVPVKPHHYPCPFQTSPLPLPPPTSPLPLPPSNLTITLAPSNFHHYPCPLSNFHHYPCPINILVVHISVRIDTVRAFSELNSYIETSGGLTCICHDTGMCHYFGYFFGVAPGFLGTFLGYSRIFGYHFLAIPRFLGIIFW